MLFRLKEDRIADAGTELKPGEDDVEEITDLARGALVLDEEGDLSNALFKAQVTEVDATIEGAEKS